MTDHKAQPDETRHCTVCGNVVLIFRGIPPIHGIGPVITEVRQA